MALKYSYARRAQFISERQSTTETGRVTEEDARKKLGVLQGKQGCTATNHPPLTSPRQLLSIPWFGIETETEQTARISSPKSPPATLLRHAETQTPTEARTPDFLLRPTSHKKKNQLQAKEIIPWTPSREGGIKHLPPPSGA